MAMLDWPNELPPMDRDTLRAELDSLIDQVINEHLHARDTLDDQFARMAAALLALLDAHEPTVQGHCRLCPNPVPGQPGCLVLATVHEYLKQPLTLVWWHQFRRRGEPTSIDAIGGWLQLSQTWHAWD